MNTKPRTNAGRTRSQPRAGGRFVQCNLSLPPALVKRLDAAAKAQKRNRSNYVMVMLTETLGAP